MTRPSSEPPHCSGKAPLIFDQHHLTLSGSLSSLTLFAVWDRSSEDDPWCKLAVMQLIQIVPSLPPRVDGIGDYALKLAHRLRSNHSIETRFVVGDPQWDGSDAVEGFRTAKVTARTREGLSQAIAALDEQGQGIPVLVQFAVYGYEKRGVPVWLVDALEAIHVLRSRPLHAAFHELENHSWKPWSSVFWVTGMQRSLLKRLARITEFRYTNTELHRRKLEDWDSGRISLILNFSTLGEPTTLPAFSARGRTLVVFGRAAQREWTYGLGGHLLAALCRRLGIERILDIGPSLGNGGPDQFGGVPVHALGQLPEVELNHHFSTALGSFQQYPTPFLTKSSTHAVSCAFGTIPFIFDGSSRLHSCPPLVTGEDFVPVDADPSQLPLPDLEELSKRVFENYQRRNASVAASVVARSI
jgi:hypothetical protein